MRTSSTSARLAWAMLFSLLLAVRLIASAGYMPMAEHGRLTLMLCPDGEWTAPAVSMPGMDGMRGDAGHKGTHHQQCPYAAAAATPFASAAPSLLALLILGFASIVVVALPAFARRLRFERPFSTGPPIRA